MQKKTKKKKRKKAKKHAKKLKKEKKAREHAKKAEKRRIEMEKEEKRRQAEIEKKARLDDASARKDRALARRNASLLLKKTEKAFMAMNLIVMNPLFSSLPRQATDGFQNSFNSIKELRDRAQECIDAAGLSFGFDAPGVDSTCSQGLKAEVLLRSLLQQMAMGQQ